MKRLIFTLFVTVIIFLIPPLVLKTNGQDIEFDKEGKRKLAEANYYYEFNIFHVALPIFMELYELDSVNTEVNYKLGVCIYNYDRDKIRAIRYFEKAKNNYIDAYYYLGRLYHSQLLFEKAIDCFQHYKKWDGDKIYNDDEIDYYIEKVNVAIQLMEYPENVNIQNIGDVVNSPYPDYVPIISSDESVLLFTSRREESSGGLLDPNGEFHEDIYISYKKDNQWTPPENMRYPVNTAFHDACVSLSADGQKLFIYRTDRELKGGDIYISELKDDKWSKPKILDADVNSKKGLETSVSLSPDENVLYFSSNRPGGYGGKDIYLVKKLPDGEWSLAQNLDSTINTPYDEDAPFIHPDGKTLYFSSKSHKNMGGYDIFRTDLNEDGTWTIPENLGYPINTVNDDVFFVVTASGKRGYYSSNRKGGLGHSDIYVIDMPDNLSNFILLKGTIITNEPVFSALKATIKIIDYETKELTGVYRTNKNTGKYVMVLLPRRKYKMIVESDGYHTYEGEIDMTKRLRIEDLYKNINLEKID